MICPKCLKAVIVAPVRFMDGEAGHCCGIEFVRAMDGAEAHSDQDDVDAYVITKAKLAGTFSMTPQFVAAAFDEVKRVKDRRQREKEAKEKAHGTP